MTEPIDPETFGRAWSRLEETLNVDWRQVFPPEMSELDRTGFMVRMTLDNQIIGGSHTSAINGKYIPALENAVALGHLTLSRNEEDELVVSLPNGQTGYGRNGGRNE